MKDVREDELFRLSLKPELSPEEESRLEAWLAAHPKARAAWEEERALGRALKSLPDVPLSSNFTAQVMRQLDLEEAREGRASRSSGGWWRHFWPRVAWAGVAAGVVAVGLHQYKLSHEKLWVKDVAWVTEDAAKVPSAEVLRDFDTIETLRRLSSASDDELILALQ